MSKDASKGYQFNISNGVVTAVFESKHGRIEAEEMDADETWSVQGNTVVKTESEHGRLEVTTYADADGDGVYAKVSKTYAAQSGTTSTVTQATVTHDDRDNDHAGRDDGHHASGTTDGYQFIIANNTVMAAYKLDDGLLKEDRQEFGESWSLLGNDVVKTEFEHGVLKSTVYSDLDGDGIYAAGIDDRTGWAESGEADEVHTAETHGMHHADDGAAPSDHHVSLVGFDAFSAWNFQFV